MNQIRVPEYPYYIDDLFPRLISAWRSTQPIPPKPRRGRPAPPLPDPPLDLVGMWAWRVCVERWPEEALLLEVAGKPFPSFEFAPPEGRSYADWQAELFDREEWLSPPADVDQIQTYVGLFSRLQFGKVTPGNAFWTGYVRLHLRRSRVQVRAEIQGLPIPVDPDPLPTPPTSPPPVGGPPTHPPLALVGSVRVSGKLWLDDTGPRYPLIASWLYGARDGHDGRPALDQMAREGVMGTRCFFGHLGGRNQSAASARRRFPEVLQWHRERGLKLEPVCITDSAVDGYGIEAHLRELAAVGAEFPDVILGWVIANEFEHSTQRSEVHDPSYLRELLGLLPSSQPRAVGAPFIDELADGRGEWPEGTYPGAGGSYLTWHRMRDTSPGGVRMSWYHEASREREAEKLIDTYDCAGMSDEPNKRRNDHPGFYHLEGLLAWGFNYGLCVHSEDGLWAREWEGGDLEALRWAVRAHRAFASVTGPHPRVFHNARHGKYVKEAAFFEPPGLGSRVWRTYGFESAQGDYMVLAGLQGINPDLSVAGIQWKDRWHVDPRDGGVIDRFDAPDGSGSTLLCRLTQD